MLIIMFPSLIILIISSIMYDYYMVNTFCTVGGGDSGGLESLIDIGSSSTGHVASEYVGVPATSSDPMLDDFLAGGSSFSEAKPAKKEEASLDDLDFWLSSDKPTAKVGTTHLVYCGYEVPILEC